MQNIEEFKIDKWVRDHGPQAEYHLHGSYASALSLNGLMRLADTDKSPIDYDLALTYGDVKGSLALRSRIAELHSTETSRLTADNVIITSGSILANYLVLTTICGPGDHVICIYPTYGQLYILPKSHGVEVDLWVMEEENGWQPDPRKLRAMIKPNTKAIIINNPNNPTGSLLPHGLLSEVRDIAEEKNITVFSDEVFRPMFHTAEVPPAFVTLGYKNSVSTGSVSKAHGLPGLRLGWVVSPNADIIQAVTTARDYTTISVSLIDDSVANFVLSPEVLSKLLKRNLDICNSSIAQLEKFVSRNSGRVRWVKPRGAGTALIQILNVDGTPVDDSKFAPKMVEEESVSVIPCGECFGDHPEVGLRGFVRVSLGEDKILPIALPKVERFLKNHEMI